MNILNKIFAFIVMVAAAVVLVVICMEYPWELFKAVFEDFSFKALAGQIYAFFLVAGNPIVLLLVGGIAVSMPGRKK